MHFASAARRQRSPVATVMDVNGGDEVLVEVINELDHAVILLTGTVTSPATTALIRDFLAAYPSGEHVMYDPVSSDAIARAQEISYGTRMIPRYRLDRADVLVTLGRAIEQVLAVTQEHPPIARS